jgi:hypothetical protein
MESYKQVQVRHSLPPGDEDEVLVELTSDLGVLFPAISNTITWQLMRDYRISIYTLTVAGRQVPYTLATNLQY